MRSRWKRIRYRLEWIGLILATKLIPLFSRRACYYLAQMAGALMPIFDRHHYKVALNNLEVAFGNQLPPRERRKIARQSFQYFARTMVDLLWSPRLTRENFRDYIEFENLEEIDRVSGSERNFITACYHYGNFEWFSLASGYSELRGTIISQEFKNSLLDPIFKKLREQSGHELIPRERGITRLTRLPKCFRTGTKTSLRATKQTKSCHAASGDGHWKFGGGDSPQSSGGFGERGPGGAEENGGETPRGGGMGSEQINRRYLCD